MIFSMVRYYCMSNKIATMRLRDALCKLLKVFSQYRDITQAHLMVFPLSLDWSHSRLDRSGYVRLRVFIVLE